MLLQILPSFIVLLLTGFESNVNARSLRDRRAVSYIANQTACVVDKVIYRDGDPIPTDDACESCKCRPPGFACVLRECEIKPGCKAIRREGECCPEYQCGCEHNGKFFKDGDRIPNAESPCYSCYCQGSSITCGLADCQFRFDCEPEYVMGECCPRYDHCPPDPSRSTTTTTLLSTSLMTTSRPPTTSETSPTPIFISSHSSSSPPPSTPHSASTADEIEDVTTMTPAMPSKSGDHPPSAATQAEKQASVSNNGSQPLLSPDATETSSPSTSLNQTSKAEASSSTTTPASIISSSTISAAVREPVVQDEVAIAIIPNPTDQSTAVGQDTQPQLPIVTTSGIIEIAQDEYLTTKTWLPDSALTAEHRTQHSTIKGSLQDAAASPSQLANVTLGSNMSSAPSVWTSSQVLPTNMTRAGVSSSESADEIRIAEPAASDSLAPESQAPVTAVPNNLVP